MQSGSIQIRTEKDRTLIWKATQSVVLSYLNLWHIAGSPSRYSNSRLHPILKTWRAHRGVDYAADAGAEIMATSDGVVTHRGWKGSFGNTVEIQHPNGFVTATPI
ncbi:MAG: hypothetical protein CM1200mP14_28890 [Gammaproteobacteria bacterium]|nr:MAG: hypothetical protein CM1200mP14_28890 [Gammaproteobacteria bacterium]